MKTAASSATFARFVETNFPPPNAKPINNLQQPTGEPRRSDHESIIQSAGKE